MVLAARSGSRAPVDIETVCAGQADVIRAALDATRVSLPVAPPTEVVVAHGERLHQLLRTVDDPLGDRLVLAVLVEGPPRVLRRVRRRVARLDPAVLIPRPVPVPAPAEDGTGTAGSGTPPAPAALPRPRSAIAGTDLFTPAGGPAGPWWAGDGVRPIAGSPV